MFRRQLFGFLNTSGHGHPLVHRLSNNHDGNGQSGLSSDDLEYKQCEKCAGPCLLGG